MNEREIILQWLEGHWFSAIDSIIVFIVGFTLWKKAWASSALIILAGGLQTYLTLFGFEYATAEGIVNALKGRVILGRGVADSIRTIVNFFPMVLILAAIFCRYGGRRNLPQDSGAGALPY